MKLTHEQVKFLIIRTLGNFFLLFSLWGMVMTFGPALYLEVLYRINIARNVRYIVDYPVSSQIDSETTPTPVTSNVPAPTPGGKATLFGQFTRGNKVEILSPVSAQFGIIIPKIGANAPIFPNVDAGNSEEYLNVLEKGVAHAAGTVFPGVAGNIYLFAHSTDAFWNVGRYNAIFYLLKELQNGDEVDLFYNGVRHVYRVVNQLIVDPSDVKYLTVASNHEQLTLQTCWPPGTTFKRLIVVALPESDLVR